MTSAKNTFESEKSWSGNNNDSIGFYTKFSRMILYKVFENFLTPKTHFKKRKLQVFDTETPLRSFGLPLLFGTPSAAAAIRERRVASFAGLRAVRIHESRGWLMLFFVGFA